VTSLSKKQRPDDTETKSEPAASETTEGGRDPPSLLGRLLYGAVLIFTGMNHFKGGEEMAQYAEAKGVPTADVAVPLSGGMLVFGGLGIVLWRLPRLATSAVVAFLVGSTPVMHDFWAVDEEQKQSEMNNFLKNTALLGAALAFLSRANE
jgi:uncharacterized membrane protein YphA (DoxX/SURF4 family)